MRVTGTSMGARICVSFESLITQSLLSGITAVTTGRGIGHGKESRESVASKMEILACLCKTVGYII